MSLTYLLKAPMKLFAKDVITFFKIRRYDLDKEDNTLRYISVKKTASIRVLRQKIWFILDLPDYCEELIILKTDEEVEVPLTELRKGNNPQHPYVLEVWLPGKRMYCSSTTVDKGYMLTMGRSELDIDSETECTTTVSIDSEKFHTKTIKSICSAGRSVFTYPCSIGGSTALKHARVCYDNSPSKLLFKSRHAFQSRTGLNAALAFISVFKYIKYL